MGAIIVKGLMGFIVGWIIYDAGYKRGKGELWEFLAKNYIVLPKGSYSCSKDENKPIKCYKRKANGARKWK